MVIVFVQDQDGYGESAGFAIASRSATEDIFAVEHGRDEVFLHWSQPILPLWDELLDDVVDGLPAARILPAKGAKHGAVGCPECVV